MVTVWKKEIEELRKDIHDRKGKPPELSLFSMPKLNHALWGIQKGKLTVISARPSNGKSVIVRQIVLDLLRNQKNVLLFSWEETKKGFLQNLACLYGLAQNFDMVTGHIDQTHEDALDGLSQLLTNSNLHVVETRGKTAGDFKRLVRSAKVLDCVIVDYANLVKKDGHRSQKEAIDEFILLARELAKDRYFDIRGSSAKDKEEREKYNVPDHPVPCAMILASQIGRPQMADRKVPMPMLSDIKESGVFEEHADVVMLLHWEYHNKRDDPSIKNDYVIIVAKNKQTGKTFMHKCFFYPEFFKVSETPLDGYHKEYTPNEAR